MLNTLCEKDLSIASRRWRASFRELTGKKAIHECLLKGSDCSGSISRCHSLQNAKVLQSLSVDDHVYMFRPNDCDGATLSRIGRNEATTFTGFCNNHDSRLFAKIDNTPSHSLNFNDPEQSLLFTLRAVAREYWAKVNIVAIFDKIDRFIQYADNDGLQRFLKLESKTVDAFVQYWPNLGKGLLYGSRIAKKRMERLFQSLFTIKSTKNYHLLKNKTLFFQTPPTLAVAAAFSPLFTKNGKHVNDSSPGTASFKPVADLVLNIVPCAERTWVHFTYHRRDDQKLSSYFSELDASSETELKQFISKIILMHCENAVFSPRFVDSLSQDDKRMIEDVFSATPFAVANHDDLSTINLFE